MASRDEFSKPVQRILRTRVGGRCSNPGCLALTIGPGEAPNAIVSIGEAAHITAASPGGPRYDPALTTEQRRGHENGIWLCRNHARLIDVDITGHPAARLREWKRDSEILAQSELGKPVVPATAEPRLINVPVRGIDPDFREWVRREMTIESPPRQPHFPRPFDLMKHGNIIVRSSEDHHYPEIVPSHDFASWFKAETWNFYSRGLEVVCTIANAVLAPDGNWCELHFGQNLDPFAGNPITVWKIGRIPWTRIADFDLDGPPPYQFPHLRVVYGTDSQPYEEIVYYRCDDGSDQPMSGSLQLDFPEFVRRYSGGQLPPR